MSSRLRHCVKEMETILPISASWMFFSLSSELPLKFHQPDGPALPFEINADLMSVSMFVSSILPCLSDHSVIGATLFTQTDLDVRLRLLMQRNAGTIR